MPFDPGRMRHDSGLDERTEAVARDVIGAAIEVHSELGPGFPESVYESALCIELAERRIPFVRQHVIRVTYRGHDIGEGRVDLIVDDRVIVENKAVEALTPVHEAQVHAYLKATEIRLGLLINFNVKRLKAGLRRIIH